MKRAEEMSLEELLRAMPPGYRATRQPDGSIVIDAGPSKPWPRAVKAAYAREIVKARTAHRVQRTAELHLEGRTAREIAIAISKEEGSSEPFAATTVKVWRRRARKAGLIQE